MKTEFGEYLLIETKSCLEDFSVQSFLTTAAGLASKDKRVTLFLIQDAVIMALKGQALALDNTLSSSSIRIFVDEFSFRTRSMNAQELLDGAEIVEMSRVVQLMVSDNCKTIWHS